MPDFRVVVEKKKIFSEDVSIAEAANVVLSRELDYFSNSDVVDCVNDISVLRAYKKTLQDELTAVAPTVADIQTAISLLQLEINALVGNREEKIQEINLTIKNILTILEIENRYGVDVVDLTSTRDKFILSPKVTNTYAIKTGENAPSISQIISDITRLQMITTINIPKKIDEPLQTALDAAVSRGYFVSVPVKTSVISDSSTAVSRFTWDEITEVE